jgi:hypothetical protein
MRWPAARRLVEPAAARAPMPVSLTTAHADVP